MCFQTDQTLQWLTSLISATSSREELTAETSCWSVSIREPICTLLSLRGSWLEAFVLEGESTLNHIRQKIAAARLMGWRFEACNTYCYTQNREEQVLSSKRQTVIKEATLRKCLETEKCFFFIYSLKGYANFFFLSFFLCYFPPLPSSRQEDRSHSFNCNAVTRKRWAVLANR